MALGITVIPANLISKEDLVRHNPRKLARALMTLIYKMRLFGKDVRLFDYMLLKQGLRTLIREDIQKDEGKKI